MKIITIGNNTDNTYHGCEDAAILSSYFGIPFNTINCGAVEQIGVDNQNGTLQAVSLVKCSGLSNILSEVHVLSAKLNLYLDPSVNSQDFTLATYGVLQNWIEGTGSPADRNADTPFSCCWDEYGDGIPWAAPGCGGVGTDRDAIAAGTLPISAGAPAGWYAIPINTDLVLSWISGDRDNYGLVIIASVIDTIILVISSEGLDGFRPYFEIALEPIPPKSITGNIRGQYIRGEIQPSYIRGEVN